MYRSWLIGLVVMVLSFSIATGQTLSIQGVIRDNTGASVADASHSLTFNLYTVETGGGVAWSEVQNLAVVNGVYSANLGAVNSLAGLDFNVQYWLGISIDGAEELVPRTKLALSPYAIAASVTGGSNIIPQSGNVGVGTPVPRSLFSLGNVNGIQDDYHDQLRFFGINNNAGFGIQSDADGGNFPTQLALNPYGGHVGIGTMAPFGDFHIYQPDAAQIFLQDPEGANYLISDANKLYMGRSMTPAAVNDLLVLDNATGNLGIGTAHPQSKLTMAGGQLRVHDAEAGSGALRVGALWGKPGIYGEHATHPLTLGSQSDQVYLNGRLGIDIETPSVEHALHIRHTGKGIALDHGSTGTNHWSIYDDPDNNLLFMFSPHNIGTSLHWGNGLWYTQSDRALKKNITTVENILSMVLSLKPKRYHFNHMSDAALKTFGFIAQDVEAVFPQLVGEKNGTKNLAYSQFGVLAIAAIQEQQEIIDNQNKLIQELMDRVSALEANK